MSSQEESVEGARRLLDEFVQEEGGEGTCCCCVGTESGIPGGFLPAISGASARTAPPRIYVKGSPAGTRPPTTLRRGTKMASRVLAGAPRGTHTREAQGTSGAAGAGQTWARTRGEVSPGGRHARGPVASLPHLLGSGATHRARLRGGTRGLPAALSGVTDKCRVSLSPRPPPPI